MNTTASTATDSLTASPGTPEAEGWYAIRTRRDFRAAEQLESLCDEIYFPREQRRNAAGVMRTCAVIPHVLFIRTTPTQALALEARSHQPGERLVPFWLYRYDDDPRPQRITPQQIQLLRLLTATDTSRCEVYNKADFRPGQLVSVTDGPFRGLTGTVQRVRKNRHVVVAIQGICMIMLPFIHPDLLKPI